MKIVCYKDKILKALNSVVKGVASKTTMPILEGILIQTNDNEVKLTTYDLEIGIEYVMECEVKDQTILHFQDKLQCTYVEKLLECHFLKLVLNLVIETTQQ